MKLQKVIVGIGAVVLAGSVRAACGGSSGPDLGSMSASAIMNLAAKNVAKQSAIEVTGNLPQPGNGSLSADVLLKQGSLSGSFTISNAQGVSGAVNIVEVNGVSAVKADVPFMTSTLSQSAGLQGTPTAAVDALAGAMADKWIDTTTLPNSLASEYSSLAQAFAAVPRGLSALAKNATKVGERTVDGHKVMEITASGRTIGISEGVTPLLVVVTKNGGSLTYSYPKSATITEPTNVTTLNDLLTPQLAQILKDLGF